MGMAYLAEKRIMHGDLAARNILLDKEFKEGELRPIAKISDFGLSKQLRFKKYYIKQERQEVPWKWMAFEFLENGKFQMKSDVWSYGVVIWELFSLGREPYPGEEFDSVFDKLVGGYHLTCPDGVEKISSWPANAIYDVLAQMCFNFDVEQRSSFSEIIIFIQNRLNKKELDEYEEQTNQYRRRNTLLLDENTKRRLKNKLGRKAFSLKH